jgi:hypothetical protein
VACFSSSKALAPHLPQTVLQAWKTSGASCVRGQWLGVDASIWKQVPPAEEWRALHTCWDVRAKDAPLFRRAVEQTLAQDGFEPDGDAWLREPHQVLLRSKVQSTGVCVGPPSTWTPFSAPRVEDPAWLHVRWHGARVLALARQAPLLPSAQSTLGPLLAGLNVVLGPLLERVAESTTAVWPVANGRIWRIHTRAFVRMP